tara:strand:- start:1139 stop:1354 length:216 start_codon:yes stop_codon:yes gene_type:complete
MKKTKINKDFINVLSKITFLLLNFRNNSEIKMPVKKIMVLSIKCPCDFKKISPNNVFVKTYGRYENIFILK